MCRGRRIKTIGIVEAEIKVCKQVDTLGCSFGKTYVGTCLGGTPEETVKYFNTIGAGYCTGVAPAFDLALIGCFTNTNLVPCRFATKRVESTHAGFAGRVGTTGRGSGDTAIASGSGVAPTLGRTCGCGFVDTNFVPRCVATERVECAHACFASGRGTSRRGCSRATITRHSAPTVGCAVRGRGVNTKLVPCGIATKRVQGAYAGFTCRVVAPRRGCVDATIAWFCGGSEADIGFSDTVGAQTEIKLLLGGCGVTTGGYQAIQQHGRIG